MNATNQNIMVTDCAFEDTNITNTSGSTTIKNSSLGDRGKISHTSGNINLTNSSVGDDFRIKGSCTLTRCSLGDDVKIENANGNVKIDQTVFDIPAKVARPISIVLSIFVHDCSGRVANGYHCFFR